MMAYSVICTGFFLLVFTAICWFSSLFKNDYISKKEISIGFLIKVLASFAFVWVYSEYYGDGKLVLDAGIALEQSEILNAVFYKSPIDYFKLLTGIGENKALIDLYLDETQTWNTGELTLFNDSKNVTRINSLIYFVSHGNPYIHAVWMAFISFVGVFLLAVSFGKFSEVKTNLIFWMLLLLPNLLFWGSGILKEPYVILGIGLLFYAHNFIHRKWKKIGLYALGFLFSILFKPYILILILLSFLFFHVSKRFSTRKILVVLVSFVAGLIFSFILINSKENQLVEWMTKKQVDFQNVAIGGLYFTKNDTIYCIPKSHFDSVKFDSDSVTLSTSLQLERIQHKPVFTRFPMHFEVKETVQYPIYLFLSGSNSHFLVNPIENKLSNVFIAIPEAFFNAMTRPYFNESGGIFKWISILELALLFGIALYVFLNRRKIDQSQLKLVVSILLFCVILATAIGFFACVSGAIVRYRIPVFIALIWVLSIYINPPEKWKK